MEKLRLHEGKMTGHEVAAWLGISYKGTYANNPKKHLEKLKLYCEFEKTHGGIIVHKIYKDTYEKNYNSLVVAAYVREVQENPLCTVSGIAEKYNFSKYAVTQVRNQLYGEVPTNIDQACRGEIGCRTMVWGIKGQGPNCYRELTQQEQEKFEKLIKAVYKDLDPNLIANQELVLQYCVDHGLSAEAYQKMITKKDINFFYDVLLEFKSNTGYMVVKVNKHEPCSFTKEADEKRAKELIDTTDDIFTQFMKTTNAANTNQ